MKAKRLLLFFFLQCVINVAIFDASEEVSLSRSAYFKTLENKRLIGHVVKRFESSSLMSCSHSCLRNAWCTSTNFKLFSENNNRGTCELNKHISPLDESTDLNDQQGITFSMLFELWYFKLISIRPYHFLSYCDRFLSSGVFIVLIANKAACYLQ